MTAIYFGEMLVASLLAIVLLAISRLPMSSDAVLFTDGIVGWTAASCQSRRRRRTGPFVPIERVGRVMPQSCRALPSGAPQTPRTGGDPDTAACCPLLDYARRGTPPIWSTLQRPHGFPRPCEKHRGCDPRPRGL